MAKKKTSKPSAPAAPPTIHEATCATDGSGTVYKGKQIDEPTAVARRQAGGEVVVCGGNETIQGSIIMKYFTPNLHARFCSLQEEGAAAHAEWEHVLTRYEKRIRKIRSELPSGLQKLCGELHLHDADLVCMLRHADSCILVLRLEPPSTDVVLLDYALVRDPLIETDVLPGEVRSSRPQFMYDEVDMLRRNGRKEFTHSILFSNGLHVQLRCRDLRVQIAKQLFLATGTLTTSAVSQSA